MEHAYNPAAMHSSVTAHLYLNDRNVGNVKLRGFDSSWAYGDFEPSQDFAAFAPFFGQWSLLMHADDGERIMSPAAHEELRQTERAIDALRARLYMMEPPRWVEITQVNIDGPLIEVKLGDGIPPPR